MRMSGAEALILKNQVAIMTALSLLQQAEHQQATERGVYRSSQDRVKLTEQISETYRALGEKKVWADD